MLKTLFNQVLLGSLLVCSQSSLVHSCVIFDSAGRVAQGMSDRLSQILGAQEKCPQDVVEFRNILANEGARFHSSMVANRGFHNPRLGSFSLFETVTIDEPEGISPKIVPEDLYFGHFTAPSGSEELTLDQNPRSPGLMVELIAWDFALEVYNFYELVGSAAGSRWVYRGNSKDIWADVSELHLSEVSQSPKFGNRLRCSGCHLSGGPIMKELAPPHDSWWSEERPLPLGGRNPDRALSEVMSSLSSSSDFSQAVKAGLNRLNEGEAFKQHQGDSLQVALRPLFCPEEINLESSLTSVLENPSSTLSIPAGFFIDPRLGETPSLEIDKSIYLKSLNVVGSQFPELKEIVDADHAWLSPVKAWSDIQAIEKMKERGLVSEEFIFSVLNIDSTRPVFSNQRCSLLRYLPKKWSPNWVELFKSQLKQSVSHSAQYLYATMESFSEQTRMKIEEQNRSFLEACQQRLAGEQDSTSLLNYLDQVRAEVSASPISMNPRGQILEPGFRVIFPKFEKVTNLPWKRTLNNDCFPNG